VIGYRFFVEVDGKLKSRNGDFEWSRPDKDCPGEWVAHEGECEMCRTGLHASPKISYALHQRQGYVFGKIESDDPVDKDEEKYVTHRMRIVRLYTRRQLVGLSALGAAMSLKYFEQRHPKDDRPRKALMEAINYVRTGKWSADSSAAAAAYAAYADAADADADAARTKALAACADIVREHKPKAPVMP